MDLRHAQGKHGERVHAARERVGDVDRREYVRGAGQYELAHATSFVDDLLDRERQLLRPLGLVYYQRGAPRLLRQELQLSQRIAIDGGVHARVVERDEPPFAEEVAHERRLADLARADDVHHPRRPERRNEFALEMAREQLLGWRR